MTLTLKIILLPHAEGLEMLAYETAGAAGMDLRAAVHESLVLNPGSRMAVPTGLVMEIPEQHEGQVRPRSGLALKHGITCLNAPGTIDWDYRGEVKVILANLGQEPFEITRGMRIAQLVIAPVTRVVVESVAEVSNSVRGTSGFGSTGVS